MIYGHWPTQTSYRVMLVVWQLGWVEIDLGYYTTCWAAGVMAEWAEQVGRLVELENLSQHNQLPDHQHHPVVITRTTTIGLTSVLCRQTRGIVEEPHFHVGPDGFLIADEPLLLGLLRVEVVDVVVLAHLQLLPHLHHQLVHVPILRGYLQSLGEVGDCLFVLLVLSEELL